jgi:hypothetical protein
LHYRDGVDAALRRSTQTACASDHRDLVLLHQEVQALHVLGDDLVLTVENRLPVQRHLAHAFDAVLLGVLQVVVDFGVEQDRFGGNAADMQTGAPQLRLALDQCHFQS